MTDIAVLEIFLHNRPIGSITHLPGDRNLFAFDQNYIDDPMRPTLSLSFKDVYGNLIEDFKSVRTRLPPFLANLLPEGHMREYLASHAHINPQREFYLLAALGNDLPGAISVGPVVHQPQIMKHDLIAEEIIDEQDGILRFSLAGVQMKFSAVWETQGGLTIPVDGVGGSWIVKLPSSVFVSVPQNEYAMMELARRIDINVPETALVPLNQVKGLPNDVERVGSHAFVIKRFDREINGHRVHFEDFAQIFGVYPEKKYPTANYRNLAEVIWTEAGQEGVVEFIRRLVFNGLIGNGDMHLKNWAIIYPDQRAAQLAPAYDFVSTIPYLPGDNLALNFVDSKAFSSLTLEQFTRFAGKARLPEKLVIDTVRETVGNFAKVWKSANDLPVDENILKVIAQHLETIPLWRNR